MYVTYYLDHNEHGKVQTILNLGTTLIKTMCNNLINFPQPNKYTTKFSLQEVYYPINAKIDKLMLNIRVNVVYF